MKDKHQEEIDLIHKLDPAAKHQAEIDLIHKLDPQLYNPNVSLNSLGLIPPTTPPSHQPGVAIPGADPINYKNLPVPAARPARPSIPWWELAKGMYEHGGESLKKLAHSAYETWVHPKESLAALTNGLPPIDTVESAVNAAPATLGGIVLNQLSPEVRAYITKDHPELQPAVEKGKTFGESAHNAGQAVVNYLDESYHSRPGEPMGTALSYSLRDRPWQTMADLSVPVAGVGAGLSRMGLDAAWRAGLAEQMVARGIPDGVAQAAVNAPRMAGLAMNPLNALIPAGRLVAKGTRKMVNALTPQRMLINAAGETPELLDQILAKQDEAVAHPIVPGSVPTSGEALGPNPLTAPVAPAAAPGAPQPSAPSPGGSTALVGPVAGTPATPVNPAAAAPNHVAAAQALGLPPAAVDAMLLAPPVGQEVAVMGSMKVAAPGTAVVPAPSNALAAQTGIVPAGETGVEPYIPMPRNEYTITLDPRSQLNAGPGTPSNALAGGPIPVSAQPPMPGTPASVPANPGSPGVNATNWAQMTKDAEANAGTDFVNLREANNRARLEHLRQTMAQTPEVLEQATAQHRALSDNTNPATRYGAAYRTMSTGDAQLQDILNRPLSNTVLDRAQNILGENRIPFQRGAYIPAHTNAAGVFVPAVYPQYSGRTLDAIKQAFDDLAFDPNVVSKSGISAKEAQAIRDTRNEFLHWVGQPNKNPDLVHAMNEYRDREQVLAQMKMGQTFGKILSNPLSTDNTIDQRLAAFRKALTDPLGEFSPTANKRFLLNATGSKLASNVEDIATPAQMQMLHSINADLEREAFDEERALKGKKFAGKLNTAASDNVDLKSLKGLPGIVPDTINALTHLVTSPANQRVAERMTNALKTPQGAAKLIRDAKAQQELFDAIGGTIRGGARMVNNLTNRVPTTYNVIEQQRDAKKKKDEAK